MYGYGAFRLSYLRLRGACLPYLTYFLDLITGSRFKLLFNTNTIESVAAEKKHYSTVINSQV
jgi:hypothetical protein